MRAVDTNIVVRYLTGDDPEQSARAKSVIDAGHVFASTMVLLETECGTMTDTNARAAIKSLRR